METFMWASFVLLLLFLGVGAIDGIYFHLNRYKLFAHSESRFEHFLHSIRALLLVGIVLLLYVLPGQGWQLYLALILVGIDLIVMAIDVWIEYQSRSNLGGLSREEYTVHVLANTLHMMALTLAFASRPLHYWQLDYSGALSFSPPQIIKTVSTILLIPMAIGVIHHFLLLNSNFRNRFN